ncbi:hypothetical protein ACFYYS_06200 [Streptomyces sp. NPDC002120]|uniref:hypothetical protein n=1 Tax=Streptomyces sp. NPDC002120 TaxID=3364631 RepID=UPI0036CE4D73
MRYYNVDVLRVFDGGISPKLVLSLVGNLPIDSATLAALRGGSEHAGWDLNAYLLADVIDLLQWVQYTLTVQNAGKAAKKVKKPEPYKRPGVKSRKKSNPFAAAFNSETGSLTTNSFQLPKEVLERSKEGVPARAPFSVR